MRQFKECLRMFSNSLMVMLRQKAEPDNMQGCIYLAVMLDSHELAL